MSREGNRRCPKGQIWRTGYTRKDGTRVKGGCIKDRGRRGKTARGARGAGAEYPRSEGYEPWIQEEGVLGEGFLTEFTDEERERALRRRFDELLKRFGGKEKRGAWGKAYKKTLGEIMVLNRSTELKRKYGAKITRARKWFVENFGGPGVMSRNPHVPGDPTAGHLHGNPSEIRRRRNHLLRY